jgi:hypothetical protein
MLVGPMGVDQNLVQKIESSLQKKLKNWKWRFIVTIVDKKDIGKGNMKRKKKLKSLTMKLMWWNVQFSSPTLINLFQVFSYLWWNQWSEINREDV